MSIAGKARLIAPALRRSAPEQLQLVGLPLRSSCGSGRSGSLERRYDFAHDSIWRGRRVRDYVGSHPVIADPVAHLVDRFLAFADDHDEQVVISSADEIEAADAFDGRDKVREVALRVGEDRVVDRLAELDAVYDCVHPPIVYPAIVATRRPPGAAGLIDR